MTRGATISLSWLTSRPHNGTAPPAMPLRCPSPPFSLSSSLFSTPTSPSSMKTPSPSSAPSPARGTHLLFPRPCLIPPSVMLYSSSNPPNDPPPADANSYPSFKLVDTAVVAHIADELDALGDPDEEGATFCRLRTPGPNVCAEPVALVGALTKALCCMLPLAPRNVSCHHLRQILIESLAPQHPYQGKKAARWIPLYCQIPAFLFFPSRQIMPPHIFLL